MSKVDPRAFPIYADGDALLHPLRVQLGIIHDEITALEEGGGGGGKQAFWFASLAGGDLASDWAPLPIASGGMTGNPDAATSEGGGLKLAVECVVQLRLWIEFASEGDGEQLVALQIDETANNAGTRLRGQAQLLPGATMVGTAYDGWLSAGVIIRPAGFNGATETRAKRASARAVAGVLPSSYVTAIVIPTGQ